jgi:F0F1-type ATP synthase membrane subunit b/b'
VKKLSLIQALFLVCGAPLVWAAGGAVDDIPWNKITAQAVNVTLAVSLLIYFVKGKAAAYFAEKKKLFFEQVEQAGAEKTQAEKRLAEARTRRDALKATTHDNRSRAEREAAALKTKLAAEAKATAQRLKVDAERLADFEAQRATQLLRLEVLEAGVREAEKNLNQASSKDLKKLDQQFVDKIEVRH